MKSTYRIPVVSAVTLGLLFCATPAVAAPTSDPTPPETISSAPPVAENEQPNTPENPDAPESPGLSGDDQDTDRSTAEAQEPAPTDSGTPVDETSPSSDPASASDPTDVSLIEQGTSTFNTAELSSEPAGLETFNQELAFLEDDAFWGLVALAPEGSENWDYEQWEAFYDTPEGQAYLDEIEELLQALLPEGAEEWDHEEWEAYLEALEEFLAQLEAIFPEGSENWDEAQWEAFLLTPEGEAFVEDFFALLFQDLDEAEIEELSAFFDALLEAFLYALIWEDLNWETTQPSPTPTTAATATNAEPAAVTTESATTEASLATTGSDSAWTLVGLGVLLSVLGVGLVVGQRRLQARKASTRH